MKIYRIQELLLLKLHQKTKEVSSKIQTKIRLINITKNTLKDLEQYIKCLSNTCLMKMKLHQLKVTNFYNFFKKIF